MLDARRRARSSRVGDRIELVPGYAPTTVNLYDMLLRRRGRPRSSTSGRSSAATAAPVGRRRPACRRSDPHHDTDPTGATMPDLPPHTSVKTYSSDFPTDENPVSEGGIWINGLTEGIDWADCVTERHDPRRPDAHAPGREAGRAGHARRRHRRRRRRARGRLRRPDGGDQGRVGLEPVRQGHRRRRQPDRRVVPGGRDPAPHRDRANWCRGYEIFFRCLTNELGYAEIVRWNGKIKDWTSLQKHIGPEYGVKTGDVSRRPRSATC